MMWARMEKTLSGHVNLGPVTLYGANAMHWAVNVWTERWGYVCFRLPLPCFGRWWPLYFYCSPNATPWAATFMLGKGHSYRDAVLARTRRRRFGHNFNTDHHADELRTINDEAWPREMST